MKLLFDQNLSPALVGRLADTFTDSSHVMHHALDQATDVQVWEFARDNGFTLVTKDSDFYDMSLLHAFPPKVIWLRTGTCTTATIEALLQSHVQEIMLFEKDAETGTLVVQ